MALTEDPSGSGVRTGYAGQPVGQLHRHRLLRVHGAPGRHPDGGRRDARAARTQRPVLLHLRRRGQPGDVHLRVHLGAGLPRRGPDGPGDAGSAGTYYVRVQTYYDYESEYRLPRDAGAARGCRRRPTRTPATTNDAISTANTIGAGARRRARSWSGPSPVRSRRATAATSSTWATFPAGTAINLATRLPAHEHARAEGRGALQHRHALSDNDGDPNNGTAQVGDDGRRGVLRPRRRPSRARGCWRSTCSTSRPSSTLAAIDHRDDPAGGRDDLDRRHRPVHPQLQRGHRARRRSTTRPTSTCGRPDPTASSARPTTSSTRWPARATAAA